MLTTYDINEVNTLILAHLDDQLEEIVKYSQPEPQSDFAFNLAALATEDDATTFGDLLARRRAILAAKSWILEVHGCGDPAGKFTSNALRFDTYEAAKHYEFNLGMRWFGFDESRVVPSQDAPTHGWDVDNGLVDLETGDTHIPPTRVQL